MCGEASGYQRFQEDDGSKGRQGVKEHATYDPTEEIKLSAHKRHISLAKIGQIKILEE